MKESAGMRCAVERGYLSLSLFPRHAVFQARKNADNRVFARCLEIRPDQNPHRGRRRVKAEAGRHHANDGTRALIKRKALAGYDRTASERIRPERVSQNHLAAVPLVARHKGAAERGGNAERLEK